MHRMADNQDTYLKAIEGATYIKIEGVSPKEFAEGFQPEYYCELHSCYPDNNGFYESKSGLLRDYVVVSKDMVPR
jgi:hypothetical protein